MNADRIEKEYLNALELAVLDYQNKTPLDILSELKENDVERYKELSTLFFLTLPINDQLSELIESIDRSSVETDLYSLLYNLLCSQAISRGFLKKEAYKGNDFPEEDCCMSDVIYYLENDMLDNLVMNNYDDSLIMGLELVKIFNT